jgi:arylsulfatase A-like enzyme
MPYAFAKLSSARSDLRTRFLQLSRTLIVILAVSLLPHCAARTASSADSANLPNVVVIMVDDMGYGDIGPFGNVVNKTPHLDRMAEEGLKLTSFYVAAPVCTPSRAALMTGCYPKRVGLAMGSWSGVLFPKDPHGLNAEEITVAELLKDTGYATGCFGKWHLGDQPQFLPTRHGFDTYFGIPYSNDMWPPHPPSKQWKYGVCPLPVLRNDKVVDIVRTMDDQAQLCKRFTDEAVAFIRRNQSRPFFVYLPHAFIHHPRNARPPFMERVGVGSDQKLDPAKMIGQNDYLVKQRTRAQIEEVDWSVGHILGTLRELGLAEKTLVIFTSDNGGASGCVNTPLRGGKGSTWEGGMREPTIAWWPGVIPASSVCDEIASTMDMLPTFASLVGGSVPADRTIDGKDISQLLRDPAHAKSPHEAFFYHSQNNLRAVRSGPWKLHANGQLYNLEADIGETKNVAAQYPEVVKRLGDLLAECRADLGDPTNCRPVGKSADPQFLTSQND